MKATNYRQVLKARGYHVVERTKYQGRNIFVKSHKYWNSYCIIEKDTHGKGQSIIFNITNNQFPKDMVEFKEAEFDRSYLIKELNVINDAFEKLKEMKSPKHLYCF